MTAQTQSSSINLIANLAIDTSPVFAVNQHHFLDPEISIIVNQGGTRSGKTYSILQVLLLYCLRERGKIIDIFRKTHAELSETVVKDFDDIIQEWDLGDLVKSKKNPYIYKINGNIIRFMGIDKAQKRRGSKRNILYINEANGLTVEDWVQLTIRVAEKIILDFNPSEYFWVNELILEKPNKGANRHVLIKSTYLDNYDYLPAKQIERIEALIEIDDFYYQVYVLGNLAIMKGKIYAFTQMIEDEEYDVLDYDDIFYGVDFGYEHYAAVVEVKYSQEKYYEKQIFYASQTQIEDMIDKLKELGISETAPMYCDHSYPASIAKLAEAGYNTYKAKKDVYDGILYMQTEVNKKLFVTKSSTQLINNRNKYKWRQTAAGVVLEGQPVKIDDDLQDAERYAIYTHRKRVA